MGGDMFQRSHLELLFIVPSTSFRRAVRAFIRAARHARTSAQQPCTAPPPPNHQRPVCTNYDGPARVAPRHAPATEAFCVSPSPTTKGQSALTTTGRRLRAYAAPPPYHQRPVCSNYDGTARACLRRGQGCCGKQCSPAVNLALVGGTVIALH